MLAILVASYILLILHCIAHSYLVHCEEWQAYCPFLLTLLCLVVTPLGLLFDLRVLFHVPFNVIAKNKFGYYLRCSFTTKIIIALMLLILITTYSIRNEQIMLHFFVRYLPYSGKVCWEKVGKFGDHQ